MIQQYVNLWYKNKDKLREKFEEDKKFIFSDAAYKDVVRYVLKYVLIDEAFEEEIFSSNPEDITEIDFGSYQGESVFIIQRPFCCGLDDACYITLEYGSCSVCDALERLQYDEDMDVLMRLCLHIIQNIKSFGTINYDD